MTQPVSNAKRVGMIAAGVALLGCLLPWLNAPLVSRTGIDTGDGKVLALLAVLAFVVGLVASAGRRLGTVYLVCGGLGATVALYDLDRIGDVRQGVLRAMVSAGIGLYLDIAAFVTLAFVGIALFTRKK